MGCKCSKLKDRKRRKNEKTSKWSEENEDSENDDDNNYELNIYQTNVNDNISKNKQTVYDNDILNVVTNGNHINNLSINNRNTNNCNNINKLEINNKTVKNQKDKKKSRAGSLFFKENKTMSKNELIKQNFEKEINGKQSKKHSLKKTNDVNNNDYDKDGYSIFEKNSYTGIIKIINNAFSKKRVKNKNNDTVSMGKMKKKEFLKNDNKKKYILYKNGQDTPINNNLQFDVNKNPNDFNMNTNLGSYYDHNNLRKQEGNIIRGMNKDKDLLLYYHDFKSAKLKKNTFLHIYEFYKYNYNSFNMLSLMPSHISNDIYASKILFESSLIGKYIILPWVENDPDIKNNLYVKYVKLFAENNNKLDNDGFNMYAQDRELNFCGIFNYNLNRDEGDDGNNHRNTKQINSSNICVNSSIINNKKKELNYSRKQKENRKKKKLRKKKYSNSRNFSMDNIFKLYYTIPFEYVKDSRLKKGSSKNTPIKDINEQKKKLKKKNHEISKYTTIKKKNKKEDKNGQIAPKEKNIKLETEYKVEKEKIIIEDIATAHYKDKRQNARRTEKHKTELTSKTELPTTINVNDAKGEKNINENDIHILKYKHSNMGQRSNLSPQTGKDDIYKKLKSYKNEEDCVKEKKPKKNCKIDAIENELSSKMLIKKKTKKTNREYDKDQNKDTAFEIKIDNHHIILKKRDECKKMDIDKKPNTQMEGKHMMEYYDNPSSEKKKEKEKKKKKKIDRKNDKQKKGKKKDLPDDKKLGDHILTSMNNKWGPNEQSLNIKEKGTNNIQNNSLVNQQINCHHIYKLNDSCLKKNYAVCKLCYKKRCIFHYVNGFQLYGWLNFKWTDPDGFLELSIRQKKKFHAWKRLSDLYVNPIVMSPNLYNNCIRQGFVADCSFLSSLTVLIEYEKKHNVPVLSSIISPYISDYTQKNKNWPIFNPSGMYICRLNCNGIQRKIIIDDYVPVKSNNSLLVAYSNNEKELWVTLLEKAFVKLMGGSYSMFGSNPGSDLYYLTGWIPVTISLKSKISSSPPSAECTTTHSAICKSFIINDKKYENYLKKELTHFVHEKCENKAFKDINDNFTDKRNKGKNTVKHYNKNKKSNFLFLSKTVKNTSNELEKFKYFVIKSRNLSMHRLFLNDNCTLSSKWDYYNKLKNYWNFRNIYIKCKRSHVRTAKLFNIDIENMEHADNCESLIRNAVVTNQNVEINKFEQKKIRDRHIGERVLLNKKKTDYEVKKKKRKQFLCSETSKMDMSAYVCGSADHYDYINTEENLIMRTDKENEETYDEKWDEVWDNMYDGIKKGKCVVCLGTLELPDAAPSGLDYPEGVSISTGIVTKHAYSILNIESYKGDKLLYIKNPWGCIRWKGKYSHHDEETWTKKLQKKLNYSLEKAKNKDDGCFWIQWKDVVKYFSHIYICWNSIIFPYQFEIHTKWENSSFINNSILLDDTHLVAYNPQFALHINVNKEDLSEDGMHYIGKKPIEIWILLSRHVRDRKTDVSQKYLALHIHAGKDRIVCPLFPIKQGIYSNGECTFTKLVIGGEENIAQKGKLDKSKDDNNKKEKLAKRSNEAEEGQDNEQEILRNVDFVLIVSQYSQKDEFNFTLKVFSHTHLSIYELPQLLTDSYESLYFKGEWDTKCAGGCSNNLWSYFRNPHIRFDVPEHSVFYIFLECSQEHSVNLRIFKGLTSSPRSLKKGEIISSGAYKSGCCYIECTLESGTYCLIPSLYRPDVVANYQICVHYPNTIKKRPNLYLIPYSYITPPFSIFKYKLISLYSLKNYSTILFNTIDATLLSLKITMFQNIDIKGIPFVNIYKLVDKKQDNAISDIESSNIFKNNYFNLFMTHNGSVYKIIQKCNMHGGPNNDILPLSTCGYDYYIKFNSILIPLTELEPNSSYLLLITTNIKEDILYNHEAHFVSDKLIRFNEKDMHIDNR
ncbi:calpain, putative [Plasmodium vinckei petteri]|uniref:Calpain, putative n=2 Tax=Plasmodium vinckei petteri TaxID=138298 RepID=A0A6V7T689_PLAVN|nr:calpain, putative [Plasmodium vinckei petteri]